MVLMPDSRGLSQNSMNNLCSGEGDFDLLMLRNKKFYVDRSVEAAFHDWKGSERGREEYLLDTQGVIPGGSVKFITIWDHHFPVTVEICLLMVGVIVL